MGNTYRAHGICYAPGKYDSCAMLSMYAQPLSPSLPCHNTLLTSVSSEFKTGLPTVVRGRGHVHFVSLISLFLDTMAEMADRKARSGNVVRVHRPLGIIYKTRSIL